MKTSSVPLEDNVRSAQPTARPAESADLQDAPGSSRTRAPALGRRDEAERVLALQRMAAGSRASRQYAAIQGLADTAIGTQPLQRAARPLSGSTRFQRIARDMEQQHGVDLSVLSVTHESAFPAQVHAEATLAGHAVHFAPGKDNEHNIRHEIGHYIVNTRRGTPPGKDGAVGGHDLNVGDEGAVDRLLSQSGHGGATVGPGARMSVASAPVQRTVGEARAYIAQHFLGGADCDIIELVGALMLDPAAAPHVKAIKTHLETGAGSEETTILGKLGKLETSPSALPLIYRRMPGMVSKRVLAWQKQVAGFGLARRKQKSSTGEAKRQKMVNAIGNEMELFHAKTAPTTNEQPPEGQGKSVYRKDSSNYARSGTDNVQKNILGVNVQNMQGDVQFANALDKLIYINDGKKRSSLLKAAATKNPHTPYGNLSLASTKQGRPSTKLGVEINLYTYNLLRNNARAGGSSSSSSSGSAMPKSYLDGDYRVEAQSFMSGQLPMPTHYDEDLFGHYHAIVSSAKSAYPNGKGKIGEHDLILVHAGPGSEFTPYPGLIFELAGDEPTKTLPDVKEAIVTKWNEGSVKMTERQSFGFLYPSISTLVKSIRIWPGQYQIENFVERLTKVIEPVRDGATGGTGTPASSSSGSVLPEDDESAETLPTGHTGQRKPTMPLLRGTLMRSMKLASLAVGKLNANRPAKDDPDVKARVLLNRFASNYGKGLVLLEKWSAWPHDVLFVEASQVVENLNEAALHLATEYDAAPAQEQFESAVRAYFAPALGDTGYQFESFHLAHSGQQAHASAAVASGATKLYFYSSSKKRGPMYFEAMTSSAPEQGGTAGEKEAMPAMSIDAGKPGSGQSSATGSSSRAPVDRKIEVLDPAYNFTDQADVQVHGAKAIDGARIYDITNFSTTALNALLRRHTLPKLSFYASFSKHFQFGTDSTTLGFVMHLARTANGDQAGDRVSYVPDGAVWIKGNAVDRELAHVPAVPAALYHHAALLFQVQTGTVPVHTPTSPTSREAQAASEQSEALSFQGHSGGMESQATSSSSFRPPRFDPYAFTGGTPLHFGGMASQAGSDVSLHPASFATSPFMGGDTEMEAKRDAPSDPAFVPRTGMSVTLPGWRMPAHAWQPEGTTTMDLDSEPAEQQTLKRKKHADTSDSVGNNDVAKSQVPKKQKTAPPDTKPSRSTGRDNDADVQ